MISKITLEVDSVLVVMLVFSPLVGFEPGSFNSFSSFNL